MTHEFEVFSFKCSAKPIASSRPQIRPSPVAEEPRHHRHGRAHPCARHRGEPCSLRRGRCGFGPSPFPFPKADRLVTVYNTSPKAGVYRDGATIANHYERRRIIPAFSSISLFRSDKAIVGESGSTVQEEVLQVSPEFFSTLGQVPAIGRSFTNEETTYPSDGVVILAARYWREIFNTDPSSRVPTSSPRHRHPPFAGCESRAGAGSASGGIAARIRDAFAATQIVLSMILRVGAELCLRSFAGLLNADPGFRADELIVASLRFENVRAGGGPAHYRTQAERLSSSPGVESVGWSSVFPLVPMGGGRSVPVERIEGYEPKPDEFLVVEFTELAPGFCETLGWRGRCRRTGRSPQLER